MTEDEKISLSDQCIKITDSYELSEGEYAHVSIPRSVLDVIMGGTIFTLSAGEYEIKQILKEEEGE